MWRLILIFKVNFWGVCYEHFAEWWTICCFDSFGFLWVDCLSYFSVRKQLNGGQEALTRIAQKLGQIANTTDNKS